VSDKATRRGATRRGEKERGEKEKGDKARGNVRGRQGEGRQGEGKIRKYCGAKAYLAETKQTFNHKKNASFQGRFFMLC